ncbi:MAG: DNA cytosine methyltransferase [Allosphingosinicella sp.]
MRLMPATPTYRVGHLFCGIGSGAKGFNDAQPRMHGVRARFVCAGGVDVDRGAIENFTRLTGTRGTVLDLFSREQYEEFHGHPPPAGWHEATPADIREAHGDEPVDVMFLSAPCKGFSGLLSTKASGTAKYQALNQLTVRGMWLALEAFKDRPIRIILFENVPRILTRGRALLDQIEQLLRAYGYTIAETTHDCGEIGNLAQSRKRMLLVARHTESVPPFLYQPTKSKLRGVGEVIGLLPLPGDPVAGGMHRVPSLQWKTWVRLAFVPAGKDWRALNDLAVENGVLRDYGIVPEKGLRDNQLGVLRWGDTAPTLTGQRSPYQGRFNVADPRPMDSPHNDAMGVRDWTQPARVVGGRQGPTNGAYSVADPRVDGHVKSVQMGVRPWDKPAGVVTGKMFAGGGPNSVADPRVPGKRHNTVFRIVPFDAAAPAVTGPGGCGLSVADPRADGGFKGKGKYRITRYDEPAGTVIAGSTTGQGAFALADPRGGDDPSKLHGKYRVEGWEKPSRAVIAGRDNGASAVADPRPPSEADQGFHQYGVNRWNDPSGALSGQSRPGGGVHSVADPRPVDGRGGLLGVRAWDEAAGTIQGESYPSNGSFSVADPRPTHGPGAHQNKMRVVHFNSTAPVITGSDRVGSGALSVADPRPQYGPSTHRNVLGVRGWNETAGVVTGNSKPSSGAHAVADPRPVALNSEHRAGYATQGHYGVIGWRDTAGAIPAYAKHDRGQWSVADPREQEGDESEALPAPNDRLVARIVARDGTWHRPFTTLELAALQSLFDPALIFRLEETTGVWAMVEDFDLIGGSDQLRREWIGNAVPAAAARGMAETIGETLMLADMGETFALSDRDIWVKPLALALAVDSRQEVCGERL